MKKINKEKVEKYGEGGRVTPGSGGGADVWRGERVEHARRGKGKGGGGVGGGGVGWGGGGGEGRGGGGAVEGQGQVRGR